MSKAPIGILGGTFDPVHLGHLALAQLALEHFGLEWVSFIPSGTPPHKASSVHADGTDRGAMLQRALSSNPHFRFDPCELTRSGYSYTIDTLHELRAHYPERELYFIIGADNVTEITSWYRYEQILECVTLAVAHRPGFAQHSPAELAKGRVEWFPGPNWALSSTMVRSYLASGLSCRYLLPDGVGEYIEQSGLYQVRR
jgi:nicotinate-nucleotide adenylyltransferase